MNDNIVEKLELAGLLALVVFGFLSNSLASFFFPPSSSTPFPIVDKSHVMDVNVKTIHNSNSLRLDGLSPYEGMTINLLDGYAHDASIQVKGYSYAMRVVSRAVKEAFVDNSVKVPIPIRQVGSYSYIVEPSSLDVGRNSVVVVSHSPLVFEKWSLFEAQGKVVKLNGMFDSYVLEVS